MMEWNVKNAVNRDVERQHLNKILKEIRGAIDSVKGGTVTQDQITSVVTTIIQGGGSSTPTPASVTVTLQGDVTGTGSGNNVVIDTTVNPDILGIPDAPLDSNTYWRTGGMWQAVPGTLIQLGLLENEGLVAWTVEEGWVTREIEGVAGEIAVVDGDGVDGNPTVGLADLSDSGVGVSPMLLFTRDPKGRISGTQAATTGDLPEGVSNLYYTDSRVYEASKNILVAGTNITLTPDDGAETITIESTAAGGGSMAEVNIRAFLSC